MAPNTSVKVLVFWRGRKAPRDKQARTETTACRAGAASWTCAPTEESNESPDRLIDNALRGHTETTGARRISSRERCVRNSPRQHGERRRSWLILESARSSHSLDSAKSSPNLSRSGRL